MLAARRAYKRVVRRKKYQHAQRRQLELLKSYFSEEQCDFWSAFLKKRGAPCPVDDVDSWTAWFSDLMAQPTPRPPLSPEAAALQARLANVHQHPSSAFDHLNADFSFEEVADGLCSLPTGKAADLQQLTCELLQYPALEGVPLGTGQPADVDGSSDSAAACSYIFEPLLRCVAWVVDQVSQQNLRLCGLVCCSCAS
jgi:hypothetical protein